jgi:hypothetical protein
MGNRGNLIDKGRNEERDYRSSILHVHQPAVKHRYLLGRLGQTRTSVVVGSLPHKYI